MAKQGAGAYTQLRRLNTGLSQSLQYWGALTAEREAEKRARQEREQVRKKKELDDWSKEFQIDPADFKTKYTGFSSVDDIHRDFSRYSMDEYIKTYREAANALSRGDLDEKRALEGKMQKIENDFNLVTQAEDTLAKLNTSFQTALVNGEVSGASEDFVRALQAGYVNKTMAIRRDKNGNLVYVGTTTDDQGNQVPLPVVPYQDIIDGTFTYIKKQQLEGDEGIINGILSSLGTITDRRPDGLFKITEQKWDDNIHGKAARGFIEGITSGNDRMADLLYQLSDDQTAKRGNFTDKDYDTVESRLMELVKAGYNQKFATDFDAARATHARALIKEDEDSQIIEAEPITTPEGQLMADAPLASASDLPASIQRRGYTLKTKGGTPVNKLLSGDANAELLSIVKQGDVYLANVRRTDKVSVINPETRETDKVDRTTTSQVTLSDEELNRLARRMGLATAADLDDYLKGRTTAFEQRRGVTPQQRDEDDPMEIF